MTREPNPPLTRRERREQARLDRPARERPRISARPARRPAWQSPMVLVSAAAILVMVAVIALNLKGSGGPSTGNLFIPPVTYAVDMVDGESFGKADAPVVMEVWSDFQCPVCAKFVREQFGTLKTQFVDPGTLRIVSHDIAMLGRGSYDESLELAVGAMCAADQGRYWPFHDLIFWNQGRENKGDHSPELIASFADAAGVERAAWDACIAKDDVRTAIRSATAAAFGLGLSGTPTISLNGGEMRSGLPSADGLIGAIQLLATEASASPSAPGASATPAPTSAP